MTDKEEEEQRDKEGAGGDSFKLGVRGGVGGYRVTGSLHRTVQGGRGVLATVDPRKLKLC